jgi:hypothetical protein
MCGISGKSAGHEPINGKHYSEGFTILACEVACHFVDSSTRLLIATCSGEVSSMEVETSLAKLDRDQMSKVHARGAVRMAR